MDDNLFLIWSEEHGSWWRPRRAGYTTSMRSAGRYTYDEALEIVEGANIGGRFNEVMVKVSSAIRASCRMEGPSR